jgi:hypothetical protein
MNLFDQQKSSLEEREQDLLLTLGQLLLFNLSGYLSLFRDALGSWRAGSLSERGGHNGM